MKYLVFSSFLIFVLVQNTDCIKCLRCNGVLNPLLCDRIKICDLTEVCMSVKYLTGNKETLYNVGCFPRNLQSCVNGTIGHPIHTNPNAVVHLDPDDHILCLYCCEGDSCNHGTCGNEGFVLNRGPICYDCQQTTDPSSCSFVRTCEDGEVCRIHEQTQLGLTYFTTSCSTKSDCQIKSQNIFGRRRRRSSLEKTECCDSDLCNGRRIGSHTSEATTTSTTNTTSTKTTTTIATAKTTTIQETMTSPIRYKDCKEWRLYAAASTGVYDIYPDGKTRITVFCDQVTDAGGWTVVLSRNGSFDGNKTWDDYKRGFGNLRGNFWLGNENIYLLTVNKINEVWFKLQSTKGVWFYASYRNVNIGTESDGYRFHMNVTSYYGNAGNSFKRNFGRLDGIRFTTIDMDNDYSSRNCAIYHGGGWWFDACEYACLTCKRNYEWRLDVGDLQSSTMMIRRPW